MLSAEWAAAEGLSLVDATLEVEALLLEGRKTYEEKNSVSERTSLGPP
jgi:hypothetical protein